MNYGISWKPLPDITTIELAHCVPLFTCPAESREHYFENLPPESKRHWEIVPLPEVKSFDPIVP